MLQGTSECNPNFDAYCRSHYGDGSCDQGCNTAECGWDGHDCDPPEAIDDGAYADGTLIIIVLVPPDRFTQMAPLFLRQLSLLLHSRVTIKKDSKGQDMIYRWPEVGGDRVVDGDVRFFHLERRKRASNSDILGLVTWKDIFSLQFRYVRTTKISKQVHSYLESKRN